MTHTDQACPKPSEVSGREWRGRWQSETGERNKTATPELPFWRAAKRCEGASAAAPLQMQHSAMQGKSAGWKLAELDISTANESQDCPLLWDNMNKWRRFRRESVCFVCVCVLYEDGVGGELCWLCQWHVILELSHPVSCYLVELVRMSDTKQMLLDLSL